MPTCSQISCSDRRSPRSVRGCNLLAGGHRSTIANGACDTVPDNALAQWWNHVTREHTRTVRHRQPQRELEQSSKLQNVLYEIRGPVHAHAARLEAEGHRILKLNIGNPAPFGFDAPDVIMRDMIAALPYAQGYSESKGILSARRAIVTRYELVPGFPELDVDDIYLATVFPN